jgi:hypothetical protein
MCRSELDRDGPEGDAFGQQTRVIVNVHRERARSYKGGLRFLPVIFHRHLPGPSSEAQVHIPLLE